MPLRAATWNDSPTKNALSKSMNFIVEHPTQSPLFDLGDLFYWAGQNQTRMEATAPWCTWWGIHCSRVLSIETHSIKSYHHFSFFVNFVIPKIVPCFAHLAILMMGIKPWGVLHVFYRWAKRHHSNHFVFKVLCVDKVGIVIKFDGSRSKSSHRQDNIKTSCRRCSLDESSYFFKCSEIATKTCFWFLVNLKLDVTLFNWRSNWHQRYQQVGNDV